MNENLDLTKILEGCPIGTEFYHVRYGKVWFVGINLYRDHPIRLSTVSECIPDVSVTKKGTFTIYHDGECLLFPNKNQRDWSKFVRFWDKPSVENLKAGRFDPKTWKLLDKVLVKLGEDPWRFGLFTSMDSDIFGREVACTTEGPSERCIPYNDDTKHLLDTTDDCPEFYKWWKK